MVSIPAGTSRGRRRATRPATRCCWSVAIVGTVRVGRASCIGNGVAISRHRGRGRRAGASTGPTNGRSTPKLAASVATGRGSGSVSSFRPSFTTARSSTRPFGSAFRPTPSLTRWSFYPASTSVIGGPSGPGADAPSASDGRGRTSLPVDGRRGYAAMATAAFSALVATP